MSQALSRRLLSGVSLMAVATALASISAASAAETFNAGNNPARTINANTDGVDVLSGATVLTDGNGNSITIAPGVTVNDVLGSAVTITNGDLLGSFINNGDIVSVVDGVNVNSGSQLLGGFVNNGNITGSSDGFDFEGSTLAGGFSNTGTITAGTGNTTSAAVEIESSTFAGGITNSGVLVGEYGIRIVSGTVSGGIDNQSGATIQGVGTAGIYAAAGTTFDGGIRNAGDISGGEGGIGIDINSTLFEDGITNVAGGTIEGDGNIAVRIAATTFSGGVTNQGNITSTGAGAVLIAGGAVTGGFNNQGNINATGGTALYIASTSFGGQVANSGSITSTTTGIHVDTLIADGIVTSGTIIAPTAIDMLNVDGQVVTQTGGLIDGDVLFSTTDDSYFIGKGGKFEGSMVGSGASNDDLTVDGVWRAEGDATGLGDVAVISGTGVFGGDFRGDLTGAGFDITNTATFGTTTGRAYIGRNTTIAVGTQTYGGEGTLEFLLANDFVHGNVTSTGAATLDGRLAAYFDWNSFAGAPGQDFNYINMLQSGLPLVGAFDNEADIDTNSIFFTANTVRTFANTTIDIAVHRIGFDEMVVAPTTNQAALGDALEDIFVAGGVNFLALEDPAGNGLQNPQESNEGLYSALFQLPSAGAYAAALSSLDGHLHAQLAEATFNVNKLFDESIRTRLTSVHASLAEQYWSRAGLDGPKYASAVVSANDASGMARGGNPGVASGRGPWSIWSKALFQGAEFEGDANAEGFDQDIGGFGAGVDYAFSGRTIGGLAVQFADSDIEFDQAFAPPGHADIESFQVAAYLSHGFGPVYLDAVGSVSFNSYETQRLDFQAQPITADYDSTVYSIYGELGTIIGDTRSLRFQPFVGVGYRSADVDDFVETCPVACLAVTTDDPESFYTDVGLALTKSYQWGSSTFMPELRASWTHEFADTTDVFQADLLGLPGVPFQVTSSEFDENRFNVGANATLAVNQGLELYAGYQYSFADDLDAHTAVIGARATW